MIGFGWSGWFERSAGCAPTETLARAGAVYRVIKPAKKGLKGG
ncbi:MAG TPA: hypothetical protein VIU29_11580 [Candidatus Deferrimicrobiaceae bacterium]